MEFKLTTNLEKTLAPQEIRFNFEEMREWLTKDLAPYRTLVVTEASIPEAKKARAEVNKLREAIDGQRKAVKKAWMSPYLAFEERCKELTGLCDEASGNIGEQLARYDEQRKAEKLAVIRGAYLEIVTSANMQEYVPFGALYNDKWLNSTVRVEAVIKEISEAVEKTQTEVKAIRALGSPFITELLEFYAGTRDLAATLVRDNALKERARLEGEATNTVEDIPPTPKQEAAATTTIDTENEELHTVSFKVTATRLQLAALREYLTANNINYERA